MDSDYWRQVESLLQAALERHPTERAQIIAEIPDAAVRAEVESLLAAETQKEELDLKQAVGLAAQNFMTEKADLEGRLLGHFRLLRRIGAGGMSEVFLAEDLRLGRKVALKMLPPVFSSQEERVRRFQREARAASALNHPNILTILEIGEAGRQLFIATEYVEGESLSTLLDRGRLPLTQLLLVGEQISSALAAAHERGILHRDIKPGNIMIRPDGLVKVLDFGLARMDTHPDVATPEQATTLPGTVLGTPAYMSPEQVRGGPVDARSDIWSLGVVLYEMATGRATFRGGSTPDILVSVLDRQPSRPSAEAPGLPPELDSLILKLLEKNPDRRFASASLVTAELKALRERYPVEPRKSFGTRMWWISAALLVASGLAAWFVWARLAVRKELTLQPLTTTVAENRVTAAAIAPDGRQLVYAERNGPLIFRRLESADMRSVPAPASLLVADIAWSRNSPTLLVSGQSADGRWSLWAISSTDGRSTLVRENARSGVFSPDGTEIAFTTGDGSEIWLMNAAGSETRKLVAGGSDTFPVLFWSARGERLSYERRHLAPPPGNQLGRTFPEEAYRWSFETMDSRSGKLLLQEPNISMTSAAALADGRILYLHRDATQKEFAFNVWEVRTDPATGRFISRPRQLTHVPETDMISITCSDDGSNAGVVIQESHSAVYIGDLQQPGPHLSNVRILTLDAQPQYPHAWTADSSAVFFEKGVPSKEHPVTQWDVYVQELKERNPRPIATSPMSEIMPARSREGEWVLYSAYSEAAGRQPQKLMRVSVRGGPPAEVPTGGRTKSSVAPRCRRGAAC